MDENRGGGDIVTVTLLVMSGQWHKRVKLLNVHYAFTNIRCTVGYAINQRSGYDNKD